MTDLVVLETGRADQMAAWKGFYDRLARGGVYHRPDYIAVLERLYGTAARCLVYGHDNGFVYYPFFLRPLDRLPLAEGCGLDLGGRFDIVSSWYYGGPLWGGGNEADPKVVAGFARAFDSFCRDTGIVSEFVRFDPNTGNHHLVAGAWPARFKWETVYVDLTLGPEAIWQGYQGRCRTAVRKAEKAGVTARAVTPEAFLDAFVAIYNEEMDRKDAPVHYLFPRSFFEDLFRTLKDNAVLFMVFVGEEIAGGSICLWEPGATAFDYLTATRPCFWPLQINNLLLHEVIAWCARAGARSYDFHGGRKGVTFFKASFSALRGRFHVAEVVRDRPLYDRLTRAALAGDGATDSSFFPAYRAKDTN